MLIRLIGGFVELSALGVFVGAILLIAPR